jgi:hypothetical protein
MSATHLAYHIPREFTFSPSLLGPAISMGLLWMVTGKPIRFLSTFEIAVDAKEYSALLYFQNHPDEVRKLDAIILKQAETTGPNIQLSRIVQWRWHEWPPSTFEKFCQALMKYLRGDRDGRPASADDVGLKEFRRELINEIKATGRLLSAELRRKRRTYTKRELANAWREFIVAEASKCPRLYSNCDHFVSFVGDDRLPSNEISHMLQGVRFSATALCDEFLGHRMRRDPEKLRQKISRQK